MNLEALADRLRSGDLTALKEMYDTYAGSIAKLAEEELKGNRFMAHQITADVFVQLWEHRENMRTIQNIKAFLYFYTNTLCHQYLTKSAEMKQFDFHFFHEGDNYRGTATPSAELNELGMPSSYMVRLNGYLFGTMKLKGFSWEVSGGGNQQLIEAVGKAISDIVKNV